MKSSKKQLKMNVTEIKERLTALEQAVGSVEFTERRFVFNQLFMQYIRINDITHQGSNYSEIYPNISKHYTAFEEVSKLARVGKYNSLTDEISDYLIDNLITLPNRTEIDLELQLLENKNFLEDCLGNFENEQDFMFEKKLRDLGREYRKRNGFQY
jgi:hypothetical protein